MQYATIDLIVLLWKIKILQFIFQPCVLQTMFQQQYVSWDMRAECYRTGLRFIGPVNLWLRQQEKNVFSSLTFILEGRRQLRYLFLLDADYKSSFPALGHPLSRCLSVRLHDVGHRITLYLIPFSSSVMESESKCNQKKYEIVVAMETIDEKALNFFPPSKDDYAHSSMNIPLLRLAYQWSTFWNGCQVGEWQRIIAKYRIRN